MRRPAIRLVLAALATSFLAACADLPTGPKAPAGTRGDNATVPSTTVADSAGRTSNQGTQI